MKVIFGGVRGSGPVSGRQFSRYGGDTTSVLVCGDNDEHIVIDAGTGVSNLLPHLGSPSEPLVLLLTHFHLDHLMGLPAFSPLYQPERPLTIVGPVSPGDRTDTREILSTFMGEPYWPISLTEAAADLTTLDVSWQDGLWLDDGIREFLPVGKLEIRACPLAHPGGCVAWRIDEPATGSSLVFATDVEWGRADDRQREIFLNFCRQPRPISLLIMDGHFTAAEYAAHAAWGHSTLEEVAEVGVTVRANRIAVTHHAPGNDDLTLDERCERFQELVRRHRSGALAFFARQGQELVITGADDSPNPTSRNCRTVLLMVHQLHQLGYQRLRIGPGMAPSGMFWRCAVTHAANFEAANGAKVIDEDHDTAQYTSGSGNKFFGWDDAHGDTPTELARKFIERFPVIARLGRGEDEAYVQWYEQVIQLAEADEFPIAYSDWSDNTAEGILPTTGGDSQLPIPPGGEA